MRTLDEVIKNYEICLKARLNLISCAGCTYAYEDNAQCVSYNEVDVLNYLKEYEEKQKTLEIKAAEYKRGFEQLGIEWSRIKDNPPLTWEQLKQMTGKPVWVEEYWAPMEDEAGVTEDEGDTEAYWAILTYADEKRISVVNGRVDQWLHKDIWNNHEVSHSWQAYRKERS